MATPAISQLQIAIRRKEWQQIMASLLACSKKVKAWGESLNDGAQLPEDTTLAEAATSLRGLESALADLIEWLDTTPPTHPYTTLQRDVRGMLQTYRRSGFQASLRAYRRYADDPDKSRYSAAEKREHEQLAVDAAQAMIQLARDIKAAVERVLN